MAIQLRDSEGNPLFVDRAGCIGTEGIKVYASAGNQIDFGGNGSARSILFGHDSADGRPLPLDYSFMSGPNTYADILCKDILADNVRAEKWTSTQGRLRIGDFYITWLIHDTVKNGYGEAVPDCTNPYPFSITCFFHFSFPYKNNGQSGEMIIADMSKPTEESIYGFVWDGYNTVKHGETVKILTIWVGK